MTLQVRLVHALGDRLIDLPDKTFESPLIIGRADTADIPVPVPSVSRRHGLLYCHEGQWYIQDASGGARTLVNGQPTPEPTLVQSGDIVTLGTDPSPPTLQIDPHGLLPAAQPEPTAFQQSASQSLSEPMDSSEDPAPDDWLAAAATADQTSQRFYVPRQNTWSPGLISATIFITIAVVAAAGYFYHVRQKAIEDALNAEKAKVVQHNEVVKVNNAVDQAANEKRLKALAAIAASATKPIVTATEMTAAQDPGRQTEEWRRVDEAHTSYKPVDAIVVFSDYMKQFPGSPYAADVRRFTEDALDAIWWEHIVQLAAERDDAKKEIVAKNRDLAQSQDPEFKKSLNEEKLVFEEKLQNAEDKLKEMNYLSAEKPNLYDAALMADLRRARNPVFYDRWKEGAEKRIRESRGQRPVW
jgi:hypothetical protein